MFNPRSALRRVHGAMVLLAAAALAGCAAAPSPEPRAIAHVAAPEPAPPPPPMFLDPPFDRVPVEGKAILINIPSYELVAFEDGEERFRSRVIVGTAKNPTPPNLTANTSVVRFRPTWTPTPSMVREEGMSPHTRPPGRNNPLGLLAIRLDPGMLIYLHGTNNPKLFEREKRALSHGCIRVEKWDEAAAFVLGITVEEVRRHANGSRTFDMPTDGIPVIVRYHTRFPDAQGVMREYPDVYGRGPDLLAGDFSGEARTDFPEATDSWSPPARNAAGAEQAATVPG